MGVISKLQRIQLQKPWLVWLKPAPESNPHGSKMTEASTDPSLVHKLQGLKEGVHDVAFHPKVQKVAAACNDGAVLTWDLESTYVRATKYCGHNEPVTSVCYNRSGRILASCSLDKTVRLWEMDGTAEGPSVSFKAHTSGIRSIQFSPSGDQVITASDDKTVKMWTVKDKRLVRSFATNNAAVRCAKYSPNGEVIATVSDDKTVRIYDADNGTEIHVFQEPKGAPVHLAWHPGSNVLGVATVDKKVKIYDIRMLKLQQLYASHEGPVSQVSFHPSGNYLASGSEDGSLKVYDLLEARPIYDLLGHKGPITAVKFSNKGDYFASGEKEKLVFVWKTNFTDPCQLQESTEAHTPMSTSKRQPLAGTPKVSQDHPNAANLINKESKIPRPRDTKLVGTSAMMMGRMTLTTEHNDKENRQVPVDGMTADAATNSRLTQLEVDNARLHDKVETLTQTLLMMEKRQTLLEEQLQLSVSK